MRFAAEIRSGVVVVSLLLLATATPAVGQSADQLDKLKRWHEKLVDPRTVAAAIDGEAALEELGGLRQALPDLTVEQQTGLFRVFVYAALAAGDAGGARSWLDELQRLEPDTRATRHAEWLVAVAGGDAQLAKATLAKLSESGAA